jgi:hypothetical protein
MFSLTIRKVDGQFFVDGWDSSLKQLEVVPADLFEDVADALNTHLVKMAAIVKEIEEYQASRSAPGKGVERG